MIRRLICAGAAVCLLAAPLAAEPGLPPEKAVAAALVEHPSVIAARARLEAASARGPRQSARAATNSRCKAATPAAR
jgi:hypothetical protein